ncbi:hypothetical protein LRB78_01065 [Borreliella americana]|uniref:hypothetical protein n=1 Tax=Borreliella americana TaxID=478807 RepID=UPI001E305FF3|nr:hypothetical protein [Borreliella americana]MCD2349279.1 hypothetical protein [Borreliella americana]
MKIYLYLFSVFLAMSCKLWYSNLNDTVEKGGDHSNPKVVGVKGMFESALKIKALIKEDNPKDMAERASISAKESKDKVLSSKKENAKIALGDAPMLVRNIRESAEKLDEAVKLLVASGYGVSSSSPLTDNMKVGIDRIRLLDKILEVVNPKINEIDNDNFDDSICKKIKEVVDEFNKKEKDEYGYSIISLNSYPREKGKDLVKKCINELMKDVEKYFGDVKGNGDGVCGELLQGAKSAPEQFSESLKLLSEAASAIAEACKRLAFDVDDKK